jgi:hypothetical protein
LNIHDKGASTFPPYFAVILDQPTIGPEWKSWLVHELALRGVVLGLDGTIEDRGVLIGFYQFLERDEAEQALQTMNVKVEALACPWIGPIRGAIGWVRAGLQEDLLDSFLPVLVRLSRGPFVRTADSAFYAPVRQMAFSVENVVKKYGFGDGEDLLDVPGDYLEHACDEVQSVLEHAGLEAQVSLIETAHNPLRIRGPALRDGKEAPSDVLRELTVTLWAYDWRLLQDPSFW